MALSTAELSLIEQRVTNDGPSAGATWLLWFFLGIVGGHRFYLGRPGSALLMILAWCCFIFPGALWWLIDAFLIPGMIRDKRGELRLQMMTEMMARGAVPA